MTKAQLLCFLFACCSLVLHSQSSEPILTLNTGMHTANIRHISTDARGRYLLTTSLDKTAKLWSLPDGVLLRTFHPPIGEGDEGKLYAGAISPDGRTVAVGGWTKAGTSSHNIYLLDANTGAMLRRIDGLPNVINDIEFSPDGRFLAAAMGENGIQVYRGSDGSLQMKDTDYSSDSYNIAFDAWGRMASVCFDGYLRLYDVNFKLLKKTTTTGGKQPYSIAFSPDGRLLAVGYDDSPNVQVLDATSLALLYAPDITNANTTDSRMEMLAFSADGTRLAAGYSYKKYKNGMWWYQIRVWDAAGKGKYTDIDAGQNGIMDIKALPTGDFVYCSSNPDWGLIELASGQRMLYLGPDLLDYAAIDKSHFRLGAGGEEVGVTSFGKSALRFLLSKRQLSEAASSAPSALTERIGIQLNFLNTFEPKINGKSIQLLQQYETCHSAAIANGGVGIVWGTCWNMYCTDAEGHKKWKQPAPSLAFCVNIDPLNQVAVAAYGDGTIRWYRFRDGQPLLTLYIHPDNKRWVLWTPSGYFDCAPGAEDLLGWHLNQGPDKEAAYFPLSKFRDKYYRPDVIDRILETLDENTALQDANAARGRTSSSSRATVLDELPPTVRILSPGEGSEQNSQKIKLAYSLQSPANEPITALRILVDGRPIATGRGFKPLGQRLEENIEIPAHDCILGIVAENRFGTSEEASVRLVWKGGQTAAASEGLDLRPKLYVLAIGVSDYQSKDIESLDYADDDARDFAAFFQKQKGLPSCLYADVQTRVLLDADATRLNIAKGLNWLVKETTSRDVAMIFFAGHGVDDRNGNFFFLTHDCDPEELVASAIEHGTVQASVASVAGKIVVFMDACHAGGLMKPISASRGNVLPEIAPVVNELISAENGAVVFCSTTNRQKALEDAKWGGHGAFTKALLEGLGGKACVPGQKKITLKSLDAYVAERVKEMTNRNQTPTTAYPPNVPDFPVSYGN